MRTVSPTTNAAADHVQVTVTRAQLADGSVAAAALVLDVIIDAGWKLFGTGSQDGLPVTVQTTPPGRLIDVVVPQGELSGRAAISVLIDPDQPPESLELRYQLCSGDVCRRPNTVTLSVPLVAP